MSAPTKPMATARPSVASSGDNTRETRRGGRARVYFDTLTMLKQLMGNVNLRDPRTWPLVIKALRGLSSMSSAPDPRITSTPPADLA